MKSICAFDMLNEYFKFNRLKKTIHSLYMYYYTSNVCMCVESSRFPTTAHTSSVWPGRLWTEGQIEVTLTSRKINFKNLNLSYLCGSSVQDEVWQCREHFQSLADSQRSLISVEWNQESQHKFTQTRHRLGFTVKPPGLPVTTAASACSSPGSAGGFRMQ